MGSFINTFCHNRPFEDIHDLDAARNENEFDTPAKESLTAASEDASTLALLWQPGGLRSQPPTGSYRKVRIKQFYKMHMAFLKHLNTINVFTCCNIKTIVLCILLGVYLPADSRI